MPQTRTPNKLCPITQLNAVVTPLVATKQSLAEPPHTFQREKRRREGDVQLLPFMPVSVKKYLNSLFFQNTLSLRKRKGGF